MSSTTSISSGKRTGGGGGGGGGEMFNRQNWSRILFGDVANTVSFRTKSFCTL